jgi:hypothetical protein
MKQTTLASSSCRLKYLTTAIAYMTIASRPLAVSVFPPCSGQRLGLESGEYHQRATTQHGKTITARLQPITAKCTKPPRTSGKGRCKRTKDFRCESSSNERRTSESKQDKEIRQRLAPTLGQLAMTEEVKSAGRGNQCRRAEDVWQVRSGEQHSLTVSGARQNA